MLRAPTRLAHIARTFSTTARMSAPYTVVSTDSASIPEVLR